MTHDENRLAIAVVAGVVLLGAGAAVMAWGGPGPGPAPSGKDGAGADVARDAREAGSERPGNGPATVGLDSVLVDRAFSRARRLGSLTSLLVSRDDTLLAESYWGGVTPHTDVNIKSASKSVLSALVGIALRDGHLDSLDQRVSEFLPEYFGPDTDPRKREITLRHLLTMTTGLETASFQNYGRWVSSDDWVGWVLRQPVVAEPGTRMIYSTGSTHLLSVILSRATGRSTREFAREELFEPLGIDLGGWQRDPQGHDFGGNNMRLSPRELLRFGRLYLNGGRHDGRQLLPASWVRESLATHTVNPRFGQDYGYLWWIRELGGRRVPYAWGYGGQFVFLVPDLDLVVVTTSTARPEARGGFSHLRRIFRIVERFVIPAAERGSSFSRSPSPSAPRAGSGPPG